jgi:hypothetical protein
MIAEVVRIDQTLDLNGGGITNFVVFRVGDELELRAAVDEDTMQRVLVLVGAKEEPEEEPVPERNPLPGWPTPEEAAAQQQAQLQAEMDARIAELQQAQKQAAAAPPIPKTEPVLIEWMSLPDNIISPMMKAAMVRLGMPTEMSVDSLQQATEQIAEKFTEADWQATLGEPAIQKAGPRVPVVPGLGRAPQPKVTFSDGTPMVPGGTPARTVPKDDMGYPIVQGAGVDPGEVVGGSDTDEDGVGQF